jgi:hypothetical protein
LGVAAIGGWGAPYQDFILLDVAGVLKRLEGRRFPHQRPRLKLGRNPPHKSGAKPAFTFAECALGSLPDLATHWQDFPKMNINHDVVEAIGNTPLIKLKRAS